MSKAFQFQVVLHGVEPHVMRKVIIPAETTFLRRHDIAGVRNGLEQ